MKRRWWGLSIFNIDFADPHQLRSIFSWKNTCFLESHVTFPRRGKVTWLFSLGIVLVVHPCLVTDSSLLTSEFLMIQIHRTASCHSTFDKFLLTHQWIFHRYTSHSSQPKTKKPKARTKLVSSQQQPAWADERGPTLAEVHVVDGGADGGARVGPDLRQRRAPVDPARRRTVAALLVQLQHLLLMLLLLRLGADRRPGRGRPTAGRGVRLLVLGLEQEGRDGGAALRVGARILG